MAQWNDAKYAFLSSLLRNVDFLIHDPNEALDEDKIKRIYAEDLLAYGAFGSAVRAVTAAGTVTLADTDPIFIEIDPDGSDRDVTFPAKADTNHGYFVHHTGSANTLTLKRSGGATITTLTAGEIKYIKPSTTNDFSPLAGGTGAAGLPTGHLHGLTLSNNAGDATNDIDFAAGKCRDNTDTVDMTLAALTKRLDANWAAGTNQGMRNSAAAITDTTYHIYAVSKAAGADPDYYAHTSTVVATVLSALQAETGGASYIYARRVGSIVRKSGAILGFVQDGDWFMWKVPQADVASSNPGTSAVTQTLTVPTGIRVQALMSVLGSGTAVSSMPGGIYISDLSLTDTAAAGGTVFSVGVYVGVTGAVQNGAQVLCHTNTSAQVRSRIEQSAAATWLYIATDGYMDTRGRLA